MGGSGLRGEQLGRFSALSIRSSQQRRHVENQRHLAIAEDGRAADALKVGEQRAQGFDHRLVFAQQGIDDQPGALPGGLGHHHVVARRGGRCVGAPAAG